MEEEDPLRVLRQRELPRPGDWAAGPRPRQPGAHHHGHAHEQCGRLPR